MWEELASGSKEAQPKKWQDEDDGRTKRKRRDELHTRCGAIWVCAQHKHRMPTEMEMTWDDCPERRGRGRGSRGAKIRTMSQNEQYIPAIQKQGGEGPWKEGSAEQTDCL